MAKENLIGRTLAGYTLRSEVGEGGTSAVFRAEHPQHGIVAVKVLREKLRQDKTAVARFVREARYGERVQHPNVVGTIEVGEASPGMHFLAIEWAAGEQRPVNATTFRVTCAACGKTFDAAKAEWCADPAGSLRRFGWGFRQDRTARCRSAPSRHQ